MLSTYICVRTIADCKSFEIGCNLSVSGKFKALRVLYKVMSSFPKMFRLVKKTSLFRFKLNNDYRTYLVL